jgi:phosphoglycolate phosphatase (TIGR01487 family)
VASKRTVEFIVLAIDYDGTLAHDGIVQSQTISSLEQLRVSGRKLVLVTGRHLPDLIAIFPRLELFDRVVVENGGVLYQPDPRKEKPLCEPPNQQFVSALRQKNVPFSEGRTVIATWQPHEEPALRAIRELGLDLQVIFNKGAVMILPSGVNKGSGLKAALDELGISPHNVVSVGDAENDLAFLRISGCSVAVANALSSVKEQSDVVLDKARGEGVIEFIQKLLANDLADLDPRLHRQSITLGNQIDANNQEVLVSPRGGSSLIAGPSGSGKSTAVAGILEQLVERKYQFCLVDPEGDYDGFPGTLSFGTAKESPDPKSVLRALEDPEQSVVINLLGVSVQDRPNFLGTLLPPLLELRLRTARPHWLVIDEAHHMLPASSSPLNASVSQLFKTAILITVHPEHVARAALNPIEIVMGIGRPRQVFHSFAEALDISEPRCEKAELAVGEAMVWFRKDGNRCIHLKTVQSTKERLRHARNYAEGELSPEQSFYFRGPQSKLNLRAHNLRTFIQLAVGVDDETWIYHLRKHDYSEWFTSMIKDAELGRQALEIEEDSFITPHDSRLRIKEIVEQRYTAPA